MAVERIREVRFVSDRAALSKDALLRAAAFAPEDAPPDGIIAAAVEAARAEAAVAKPDVALHNRVVRAGAHRAFNELEPKLAALIEPILRKAGKTAAAEFKRLATKPMTAAAYREADIRRLSGLDVASAQALLRSFVLTAAAPPGMQSNSTMVCVKPTPAQQDAVGGDSTTHCTLVSLGSYDGDLNRLAEILGPVAASFAPLSGQVGGDGEFGTQVQILLPDVPGLVELRVAVTDALVQADVRYARDHGFLAHMTREYLPGAFPPDVHYREAEDQFVRDLTRAMSEPITDAAPRATLVFGPFTTDAKIVLDEKCQTCAWFQARGYCAMFGAAAEAEMVCDEWTTTSPPQIPFGAALDFLDLLIVRGDTEIVALPLVGSPPLTAAGATAQAIQQQQAQQAAQEQATTAAAEELASATAELTDAEKELARIKKMGDPEAIRTAERHVQTARDRVRRALEGAQQKKPVPPEEPPSVPTPGAPTLEPPPAPQTPVTAPIQTPTTIGGQVAPPTDLPSAIQQSTQGQTQEIFTNVPGLPDQTSDGQTSGTLEDIERGIQEAGYIAQPDIEHLEQIEAVKPLAEWQPPAPDELLNVNDLASQVRDVTDPVRQAVVQTVGEPIVNGVGLQWDAANPFSAQVLAQSASQITSISQTTQANVMQIIQEAHDNGWTIPDTAKAIQQGMADASPERATLIARCLPPDALVDTAVVRAVTRRWYEGDMAVFVTESGREFTATPNHPMLTSRGWLTAGELHEGDHLICRVREQDSGAARNEDVANPPAAIAEIFSAAAAVGVVDRSRGRQPDFHGDGSDGDVDVARPHVELRFGRFAAIYEHLAEILFPPADEPTRAGFCPSCGHLLAVDKAVCFCGATGGDTLLAQHASNEGIRRARQTTDCAYAVSGDERLDDLFDVNIVSPGGGSTAVLEVFHPGFGQGSYAGTSRPNPTNDGAFVDAELVGDLPGAHAGQVERDRIILCSLIAYSGQVFNIDSPHGYFTVNGGYTGNTELAGAVNGGSLAATQIVQSATGVQYAKVWTTAPGARYPRHENYPDLDGQTMDQLDGLFTVGDAQLRYPGDPDGPPEEVCNCRCTLIYQEVSDDAPAAVPTTEVAAPVGTAPVPTAMPSIQTSDPAYAAQALANGDRVTLNQPDEITTFIDDLGKEAADAQAAGEAAPDLDLGNVTVKGTNLFTQDSLGIPRIDMPQLSGTPLPGSLADRLPKIPGGYEGDPNQVNIGPLFYQSLRDRGVTVTQEDVLASHLKSTQSQINGPKVAKVMDGLENGTMTERRIPISKDNYIVDGHHQWAATIGADWKTGTDANLTIPVDRIDQPITTILDEANAFAKKYGIPQASAFVPPVKDADVAALDRAVSAAQVQTAETVSPPKDPILGITPFVKRPVEPLFRGLRGNDPAAAADASRAGVLGGGDLGKGIYLTRSVDLAQGYGQSSSLDKTGIVIRGGLSPDAKVATEADIPKGTRYPADWAAANGYDAYDDGGNVVVVVNPARMTWDKKNYTVSETAQRDWPGRQPIIAGDSAVGFYDSVKAKQFESDLRSEAANDNLTLGTITHTGGVWEGATEPSYSVHVYGDQAKVAQYAETLRNRYDQDGVMVFTPQKDLSAGMAVNSVEYRITGVDPAKAVALLAKYGFTGATTVGREIEIVGTDADGANAAAMAAKLGGTFSAREGHVQFVERKS